MTPEEGLAQIEKLAENDKKALKTLAVWSQACLIMGALAKSAGKTILEHGGFSDECRESFNDALKPLIAMGVEILSKFGGTEVMEMEECPGCPNCQPEKFPLGASPGPFKH